jgi:hypothetical protein
MITPLSLIEKEAILEAVELCNGDKYAAAKALGIGKTSIFRKLKLYRANGGDRSQARVLAQAAPLKAIVQPRFLRLPRSLAEAGFCDLECPNCHRKVLLPNGASR